MLLLILLTPLTSGYSMFGSDPPDPVWINMKSQRQRYLCAYYQACIKY